MTTSTGQIAGRVVDPAGEPVSGAIVAIASGDQPFKEIAAVSGADGTFHFGGMLPGSYGLSAKFGTTEGQAGVTVIADQSAPMEIVVG